MIEVSEVRRGAVVRHVVARRVDPIDLSLKALRSLVIHHNKGESGSRREVSKTDGGEPGVTMLVERGTAGATR